MKDRHKFILFPFLYNILATNYSCVSGKKSKRSPVLNHLSNEELLHNLHPTPTKLLKIKTSY